MTRMRPRSQANRSVSRLDPGASQHRPLAASGLDVVHRGRAPAEPDRQRNETKRIPSPDHRVPQDERFFASAPVASSQLRGPGGPLSSGPGKASRDVDAAATPEKPARSWRRRLGPTGPPSSLGRYPNAKGLTGPSSSPGRI